MKILVTGAAGFIGFHLVEMLIKQDYQVVGIDNINEYYDINLKYARLAASGIDKDRIVENQKVLSSKSSGYFFQKTDITDPGNLKKLFEQEQFDLVVHMAAQAGVRYSLENPDVYIQSNVAGFVNILESCRHYKVKNLIYASSSSVYGMNNEVPFKETANVDSPVSLYAATKKTNELLAYTYSYLYDLNTIGLRFFTVYGPWGRPDMAMFLFTDAVLNNRPIKVFNQGNLSRDFTYIDDVVGGIRNIIIHFEKGKQAPKYNLYNIGNSKPVKLMEFIETIEIYTNKKAIKEYLPMQPGDVEKTWAEIQNLQQDFDYLPHTPVTTGVGKFIDWYKQFYNI